MRSGDSSRLAVAIVLLGASAFLVNGAAPVPQEWGSVTGRVVWAEEKIPANPPIAGAPPRACLAQGPILENRLVVDPKSKGVRWVLVWLADPKDATNAKFTPAIHPSLTNPPDVEIDRPCCEYEPRVLGLWGKQKLTVMNSGKIIHNFTLPSLGNGPRAAPGVLPKSEPTIKGFVPSPNPLSFSCGVHTWMKGYVGTFAHPYFAVTDAEGKFEIKNAPAGKFQLLIWHEAVGFLTMKSRKLRGKVIEIRGKGVTDVGKVGMKQPED